MATDAEIRAAGLYAVPKNKYLQNEFQLPTEEVVEETESFGIPQTKAFTNSGGNDFSGSTSNLGGDFQRAVDARQNRLNAPIDNSTFLGKAMGTVKNFMNPQSADEIMAEGYQEPRFQPGIIGTIMGKLDNYRNLPQADQAFIAQNMGYTGPTIFGENNSGLSKDEFGINTRSLFGNYAAYVDKMNEKKNDKGVAVKDMTDDEFDDYTAGLKGMKKKSAILYKRKLKERQTIIDNKKAADLKAFEDQKTRSGITSGANDGRYENIDDRDRGGQGAFKEDKTSMKSAGKSYQDAQGSVGYSRGRKDGGRIGYFFGGRVNYKVGGRTDAGPNRTTASKAGVGQINEAGNKVDGGNYSNNNDGGDGIKPTFYDNNIQVITDKSKLGFDYPTGLTKNLGIGQLTAILNAKKSLEEEKPEGFAQYDSSIGPFNTTATYDTITGPEFNANYTNNNLNANLNSKTGLGVDYSKDIGPGTFTAGGTYSPDGTYNAEAKYGISFANGGLASIL